MGDIELGMHKVRWFKIFFFNPNTIVPDYKVTFSRLTNTDRILFFYNNNSCGILELTLYK